MGVKKQFTMQFYFYDISYWLKDSSIRIIFFPVFQNMLVEWARGAPDFVWLCHRQIKSRLILLSEPWAGPSREKLESTLEGPEASSFLNGS